ncbi:PaaI family thioesterase [Thioclava electrotropha]|uniref:PaaI family thioesterase n=1 Tax=Thioclava electrotropha TaxID=1549850 RepID=A0ABX6YYC3_9RHOB|nr:PaaI family thioesterase [Thioclava electrotropha]QPZ92507.1 PaaI family thioesterase [Thioclava electrotropha]
MPDQYFAEGPDDFLPLEEVLSMSGLDYVRKMVTGDVPSPTVQKLMAYRITEAEEGRVTCRGTPGHPQTNGYGGIHGGWYAMMLDTVMTCSVITGLKKGQTQTTLEFKVNLIRAIKPGTEVIGVGQLDHIGRSTGVARGEIRGAEDGRLYATGTATCFVMTPEV